MSKLLCLLLILTMSVFSMHGDSGEFNELLHKSAGRTSAQLIADADSFMGKGNEDDAMIIYMIVASRQSEGATPNELAYHVKANLKAGNIHYNKGNYSNALRYYVAGLKLSETLKERPYLSELYKNMGNVYNIFQDFEKGQSLYLSGLEEAYRTNDSTIAYKLLQNLVGVSINLNDVDAARKYYEQSKSTKHKATEESVYMDNYTLALILKHEGKTRESVEQFKELARLSKHNNLNPRYQCSAYGEIGRIYNEMGYQDSAMYYLSCCKDIAQANGILYQYTESLKMLYTLYDHQGERGKATELKDRYLELKDSMYDQRQIDLAKKQQFLYEIGKKEQEIAELSEKQTHTAMLISRQRMVLWIVAGAVIIALLLLYYFYTQKKKLSESYHNLYEIHQRMITDHRDYIEKQTALSQENVELHEEISRLNNMLASPEASENKKTQASITCQHTEERSSEPKYEKSTLSRDQKDKLTIAITETMEHCMPFCSPEFSLNSLASLVNSNSKYVSQVINDVFKKNFSTFVNEYRVNLACARLADNEHFGQYSMNGIGESVGFQSNATFATVFKKITGITPSIYQKMIREKQKKTSKQGI